MAKYDWIAGGGNASPWLQFDGVVYTLMVRCRHEVDGGDWPGDCLISRKIVIRIHLMPRWPRARKENYLYKPEKKKMC